MGVSGVGACKEKRRKVWTSDLPIYCLKYHSKVRVLIRAWHRLALKFSRNQPKPLAHICQASPRSETGRLEARLSALLPSHITVQYLTYPKPLHCGDLRKSLFPPLSFFLAGCQVRTDNSGIIPLDLAVPGVNHRITGKCPRRRFSLLAFLHRGKLGFLLFVRITLWHGAQCGRLGERREVGGGTEGSRG